MKQDAEPATLVVVCGLPGVGKTTHAQQVAARIDAVRLCPDDWMDRLEVNLWDGMMRSRIETLQWDLARDLLALRQSVVIEWGTWARSERDLLRDGGRATGALVELHHLEAPIEVLWSRIRARDLEDPPITHNQLRQWIDQFETPEDDELATWDHGVHIDTT